MKIFKTVSVLILLIFNVNYGQKTIVLQQGKEQYNGCATAKLLTDTKGNNQYKKNFTGSFMVTAEYKC